MELQNVFTAVFNMTVTGSIVILCVLAARLLLKKAPRVFSWALWLVVLFRLLCPVTLTGPVSVLWLVDAPASGGTIRYVEPPVRAPLETMYVGELPEQEAAPSVLPEQEQPIDWNLIGTRVWVAGFGILLGYGIISYVNLKRKLRESVPMGKGIREADGISSPFVLGRTIYLPALLREEERSYILLHEQLHLRHGDPAVKLLFWLAVCLHWFNPLVWLSFFLCARDMELRCDEAVLGQLGGAIRSDYAQSLLNCAAGRRFAPVPLAFGEGDTGRRVKFVLGWKKAKLWIALPAAVLCAVVLVLTGCNPAEEESPFGHSYRAESSYAAADIELPINTYYTLTSDMGLYIRGEKTELVGFFRETVADSDNLKDHSKDFIRRIRRSWHIEGSGWWLFEMGRGELQLHNLDQSVTHCLGRIDLLGVTVKQPGVESYVEPMWYPSDWWNLPIEELSTTLVDGDAEIILMPETDVDRILVSEEYYEQQPDGETAVTVSDHFLERDAKGDFALKVSRRGTVGDDYAVYYVTVGEERYVFRLSFPAVPGETSVAVGVPEQTREVRYSEGNAWITLQLPESWTYDITYLDDPELDAGISAGITFWPLGREEGKLFFGYYPAKFAVCGTGLQTTEIMLAGQKATVGTYDDRALWDFIRFGEHFAVWGQNHEVWWAEYGEKAMEILDSAKFEE
ncbi:MAG: hypothetical protein IJA49_00845 [Oscillospiraceae bacterium]|nr:hypothetical protein [Oscillospiraceae bacterium]